MKLLNILGICCAAIVAIVITLATGHVEHAYYLFTFPLLPFSLLYGASRYFKFNVETAVHHRGNYALTYTYEWPPLAQILGIAGAGMGAILAFWITYTDGHPESMDNTYYVLRAAIAFIAFLGGLYSLSAMLSFTLCLTAIASIPFAYANKESAIFLMYIIGLAFVAGIVAFIIRSLALSNGPLTEKEIEDLTRIDD